MSVSHITFNGGRLGNQLYYALQAFKLTTESNKVVYSVTGPEPLDKIYQMLCSLGLDSLVSFGIKPERKIDSYCQKFGVDFTSD